MRNLIKAGQRYGRLTVLYPTRNTRHGGIRDIVCQCRCGNLTTVAMNHLTLGRTLSCGCYRKEQFQKCVDAGLNQGEKNPTALLTAEDVKEVKRLRTQGLLQREIADVFGVARTTVSAVLNGYNWHHLAN